MRDRTARRIFCCRRYPPADLPRPGHDGTRPPRGRIPWARGSAVALSRASAAAGISALSGNGRRPSRTSCAWRKACMSRSANWSRWTRRTGRRRRERRSPGEARFRAGLRHLAVARQRRAPPRPAVRARSSSPSSVARWTLARSVTSRRGDGLCRRPRACTTAGDAEIIWLSPPGSGAPTDAAEALLSLRAPVPRRSARRYLPD